MRSLVTFPLIVALLVCPVFCLGDAARACAAPQKPEPPTCCHACEGGSSPNDAPVTPPKQDADCVCHGAIVGVAAVDGPRIASGHLPPMAVAAPAATVCDVDQVTRSHRDSRDLPCESGRYLCALICVRLL
ncbi:MAG: hypothetical protein IIA67_14580 [Planctomycetes bacterium]|nr:hypothetical protein [Planctomycetota bacterium]